MAIALGLAGLLVVAACGDPGSGPAPGGAPTATTGPPPPAAGGAPPRPTVGTVPAGLGALTEVPAAEPPVTLRVPAIDVEAVVRPVGVEADGSMTVPPAHEVGWYRFGPAPGDAGTAVLAAHVDFDGRPGAFFRLRDLAVGDEVVVATADGGRSAYAVVAVERVPKDELAATAAFARDGPPRLALVTCGGAFDRWARSYADNVVAYAEPAPAPAG